MSLLLRTAERDMADGRAFLDRGRAARRQFRFIISAEGSGPAYPHRSQSFVEMQVRG